MRDDEVMQSLIVIDEAPPMLVMRFSIKGGRLQAFVLGHEIVVFSEKRAVFFGLCHSIHGPHPSRRGAWVVSVRLTLAGVVS